MMMRSILSAVLFCTLLSSCDRPPISAHADPFQVTVDTVGPYTWHYSISIKPGLLRDTLAKITMVELISNSENVCSSTITSNPYIGGWTRDAGSKSIKWTNTVSGTYDVDFRVQCEKVNGHVYLRVRGSRDSSDINMEERIIGPIAGPVN